MLRLRHSLRTAGLLHLLSGLDQVVVPRYTSGINMRDIKQARHRIVVVPMAGWHVQYRHVRPRPRLSLERVDLALGHLKCSVGSDILRCCTLRICLIAFNKSISFGSHSSLSSDKISRRNKRLQHLLDSSKVKCIKFPELFATMNALLNFDMSVKWLLQTNRVARAA
jgi:hypothetical protein